MKTLNNNEVAAVSGGNSFLLSGSSPYNLYGGGFYDSSSNYGVSLGAGYTFNLSNSTYLTTQLYGFNFGAGGSYHTPTFGISLNW